MTLPSRIPNILAGGLLAALSLTLSPAASAQFSASIARSTPAKSDPGNEITQTETRIEYRAPVLEGGFNLTAGGALQENRWSFDEPALPAVDLLKIKIPLESRFKVMSDSLMSVTLIPGLHGETSQIGDGDFRLEGVLAVTTPHSPSLLWVYGLGWGDTLGKVRAFPVLGAIWRVSDRITVNTIMPKSEATYIATPTVRLKAELGAAGGQWRWTFRNNLGTDLDVDAELKGSRLALGADWDIAKGWTLSLMGGMETGRELTLTNRADSSRTASLELQDTRFLMVGITVR